jgi:hypothetical protein
MTRFDQPPLHDFPDRALRRLLQNPGNLRDLLADLLPDLIDRFDFSRLEVLDRDFPLEDWRRRESDLLFRLPFLPSAGDLAPVLVCVLVEHQSDPDPWMPLRMLLYAVLFWEREWKAWETQHEPGAAPRLTPVLPVVFHTGPRPWRRYRRLAALLAGPREFRAFVPRWHTLFWDLADRSAEEMLQSAGEWLAALAVVRAEREDAETFRQVLARVLRRLEGLSERERMRWHDLLHFVLSWALRRRPRGEQEEILGAARESQDDVRLREEIETMGKMIGQSWEQELLARGQLLAQRDDLRALLEERFGALPTAVAARIEAADDPERLRAALRQAIRIASPEDLEL